VRAMMALEEGKEDDVWLHACDSCGNSFEASTNVASQHQPSTNRY
jgi:hypothetical protein